MVVFGKRPLKMALAPEEPILLSEVFVEMKWSLEKKNMITRQIDRFDCATCFEFVCYFCREGVVNFRMRQVQILGNILKVQANLDLAHYSVVDVILCGKKNEDFKKYPGCIAQCRD